MSITFTAASVPVLGYVVSCGCAAVTTTAPRFGTYADAEVALAGIPFGTEQCAAEFRTALPGCTMPEICPDYRLRVEAVYAPEDIAPEVQVAYGHVPFMLATLGLTPEQEADLGGLMEPAALLGRVLVGAAVSPADEGTPATGTRFNHGGRHAGYLERKLAELRTLAAWCAQRDRLVTWG